MNEWIIAPLLAPDPTGMVSHSRSAQGNPGKSVEQDVEQSDDRRHGDRRDNHDEDADPDFARGDDRREGAL